MAKDTYSDSMSLLMQQGKASPSGTPEDISWGAFLDLVGTHELTPPDPDLPWQDYVTRWKDGTGFSAGIFTQGYRSRDHLEARTAIVLDVEPNKKTDAIPPDVDTAALVLDVFGLAGAIYTSFQHRTAAPRYRVVLPLSVPQALPMQDKRLREIDKETVRLLAQRLQVGAVVDTGKIGADSFYYLPRCPEAFRDEARVVVTAGAPVDDLYAELSAEAERRIEAETQAARDAAGKASKSRGGQVLDKARRALKPLREVLEELGYIPEDTWDGTPPMRYLHPDSTSGSPGVAILMGDDGIERTYSHHESDPMGGGRRVYGALAHDVIDHVLFALHGHGINDMGSAIRKLIDNPPARFATAGAAKAEEAEKSEDEKQAELDALHAALAEEEAKADFSLITDCPPGAFKRLVEHGYQCLDYDLPEMALMIATAAVGACAPGYVVKSNRHYTAVNNYSLALGPSGVGKSFIEGAIASFASAAGIEATDIPVSAEAVHQAAIAASAERNGHDDGRGKNSAVQFWIKDEIADWLSKAQQASGTSQAGAHDMALSLSNRAIGSGAKIAKATRADQKKTREQVSNPYLSIAAFTTRERYLEILTESMVVNGWGNRVLHFIIGYDRGKPRDILYPRPDRLPADLVAVAKQIGRGGNAANGTAPADTEVFWSPDPSWHRWCRILELSEESQRYARKRQEALRERFRENDYHEVLPGRLLENSYKLAGQISLLDYADQAAMAEEWPKGRLEVKHEHLVYAIGAVEKLLTQFAELWAGGSANSQEGRDGRKIMEILKSVMKKPQMAKKRKNWVEAVKAGWVPASYIKDRMKSGDATEKALKWLVDTDAVTSRTAKELGLLGLSGSTVVYRLKVDD